MQEQKIKLVYKFENVDADFGIDIFKAGPLFVSLGELIKEANQVVGKHPGDIGINIKPATPGSYIQELIIYAPSWYSQLTHLINNPQVRDLKEILEWIGIIGTGGPSLVKFIKWCHGKWDKVEDAGPNEYKYFAGDQTMVIPGEVHTLIQNNTIQNNIKNVFYAYPRDIAGEEVRLTTYDADIPGDTKVEFTKEDIDDFGVYGKQELLEVDANETVSTFFLKPKHGSYRGDKGPYSFFINGKDILAPVYIEDETFLNQLMSGDVRLHEQDLLKVQLRTIQKLDVNNELRTTYYIVEVLEYKQGIRQQQAKMDLGEG
jgi:hypothetical protein